MGIESGNFNSSAEVGEVGSSASDTSIKLADCTMALLAIQKRYGDKINFLLKPRTTEQDHDSTTYDCVACPAKLNDAGFSNIAGDLSCRSQYLDEAQQIIAE